jgi:arylsulfatase A-like enzyme
MAHYAVHIPMNADKRFYKKYTDTGLSKLESAYASMIEGMDKSLGDLMNYLERHQLTQNTIILFMSDNGGFAASNQWRTGTLNTQNAPLNSGKGSAYEGGIREPMIVKWPEKVRPKTSCNTPVIIEDFFPTILEMAGVKHFKTVQKVDGKSFTAVLSGKKGHTNRPLFWHFPNNWGPTGPGIGATSTIRKGDFKLVYWYKDQHFDLFNIPDDIGEKNNLAAKNPEKVMEMATELGKYLRKVDAQRPTLKSNGQLAPWPDRQ